MSNSISIGELYNLSRQFLELHYQTYERTLFQNIMDTRLNLIVGQRGVGKTTFLIQKLLKKSNFDTLSAEILYVPTDHFLIGKTSLYEIAEMFYQMNGKFIVFDEIHQYPDWSKELKSIFDTFPKLFILASGSSALKIRQGSHDLSRRAITHHMPGYSFREYLELQYQLQFDSLEIKTILTDHVKAVHHILEQLESRQLKILQLFNAYLETGYYPYAHQFEDKRLYYRTLEQNLHLTLDADLPSIYPSLTGYSIRKIKQLMSFIAREVPFTANLNKLKSMLEIGDERTLKTYLSYLHDSSLIRLCMKSSKKIQKIESPEKIYLDNPNQMIALSAATPNTGTLRELFFLSMLSFQHEISIPQQGDFMIDDQWLFEIGGRKKEWRQIQDQENAYLVCDDIEYGVDLKIPLWLFGFIY